MQALPIQLSLKNLFLHTYMFRTYIYTCENLKIVLKIVFYVLLTSYQRIQIYYWIYNLIRAVFWQNLNAYLRKTCKIVLFKVLPIWSYDFFPSFWQFSDSIPKELRRLGGQEWIKPNFDTLFWCEPYSSEDVLHRLK